MRTPLFAVTMLLAVGCSVPEPFGGFWTSSISGPDLVPVMPPSEDVRVGDVFVRGNNGEFSSGTRWTSLSVGAQLLEEYHGRSPLPPTPESFLVVDTPENERAKADLEVAAELEIFGGQAPTTRLPLVEFGSLGGRALVLDADDVLVPPEVATLVLGPAGSGGRVARIRVSSAESYALPLTVVLSALIEREDDGHRLRAEHADHLGLLGPVVEIDVLTEVVYARSLDIAVQTTGLFDEDPLTLAELDADGDGFPEGSDGDEREDAGSAAEETEKAAEPQVPVADHEIDPTLGAFARARAINELMIESNTADTPSTAVRVVAASDDFILVRRLFRRGLAVAVRGVRLRIDAATGAVLEIAPLRVRPAASTRTDRK